MSLLLPTQANSFWVAVWAAQTLFEDATCLKLIHQSRHCSHFTEEAPSLLKSMAAILLAKVQSFSLVNLARCLLLTAQDFYLEGFISYAEYQSILSRQPLGAAPVSDAAQITSASPHKLLHLSQRVPCGISNPFRSTCYMNSYEHLILQIRFLSRL